MPLCALAAATALHTSVLAAPPVVTFLPAGSKAYKTSDDGSVVVGLAGANAFRWTKAGGYEVLSGIHAGLPLVSVSGDGLHIVSDAPNGAGKMNAAFWEGGSTWSLLPTTGFVSCDAFLLNGYDTNSDGSVVVGLGWITGCKAHAFRWDSVNGSVDLGSLVATRSSRANGVNADGTIIVGWQDTATGQRRGARWIDGVESYMPNYVSGASSYVVGEALGISDNGQHIVGYNVFNAPAGPGWHFDDNTDTMYALQNLAQFGTQDALVGGVTDDGTVCVGSSGGIPIGRKAIIWFNNGAPLDLVTHIQSLGGSTAPYTSLGTAMDISPDGRTIVGWGTGPGNPAGGWIVHFPIECPADLNDDGTVGADDLAVLLGAWGGRGSADLTGDGVVGAEDLAILLGAWGACPN
ncbi:MAG: hypothetical protein JNL80_17430 [Phycisphaerae bacterium]|jgi:probable HAF family extracellular repeat protein|nr:hypothetical protein [Phycisphaerae bacterium]